MFVFAGLPSILKPQCRMPMSAPRRPYSNGVSMMDCDAMASTKMCHIPLFRTT